MTGVALASFFAGYDLVSPWFITAAALLVTGAVISQIQAFEQVDPVSLVLTGVILISGVIAVCLQRDAGVIYQKTAVLLAYPAMYSLLLFIRPGPSIFAWLLPVGAVHAALIIWQGLALDIHRPTGLTDSANPAGGLLAILAIFVIKSRWWPIAIPMLFAMALTGSRLAALAFLCGLAVSLATEPQKTAPAAISVALAGALCLVFLPTITTNLFYREGIPVGTEAVIRLGVDSAKAVSGGFSWLGLFIPSGVNAYQTPIHSLYLSIALEYGAIAFASMIAMLALSLRRLRRSPLLPLATVLLVLASLDLYLWIGPMAWAWWWFMGLDSEPEMGNGSHVYTYCEGDGQEHPAWGSAIKHLP